MSLHPDREELMAWSDGEVTGARAAEVAAHTAACDACRTFVQSIGTVSAQMSSWTVDAPPATLAPPAALPSGGFLSRRAALWTAAAVFVIGVLATVRVDCAPAPICDLRTAHFAFMRSGTAPAAAEQARSGAPARASQAFERDWLSRRRLPIPAAPGAKVTVVIFLDWQCPACRVAEQSYNVVFADFEKRMPGAVAVVIKDYPLNMRCNPNVPVEMHPAACEAAVAVRLSREHGTTAALVEWLFANQESLTPDRVRSAAQTIGKVPDFTARYTKVLVDVARDVAQGKGLEVSSTPTCFINGILARNDGGTLLFSAEEVRHAIDTELKRVK